MIRKLIRRLIIWAVADDFDARLAAAIRKNNRDLPTLKRDIDRRFG